ncbi:MAG: hypothetical protein CVU55_01850 [Deltaproteobacteria bacterium HGW-Deltaproteobacteria-13]|jgi:hypothetical protein|nr:MAG: hypothetical protein CVU55_01850 [Deltaproteobacteria bacterium HGW-Deltaproteobacteria-13]
MSEWVKSYEWEIWFTGTFKPKSRIRDTINAKLAFNRWIENLSKGYDKHNIQYFLAVERFKSGFDTHCHALVSGVGDLKYCQLGEAWRALYGREQVEGYQKDKGADYYLTKYVTKELCDWDFRIKKK